MKKVIVNADIMAMYKNIKFYEESCGFNRRRC